MPTFNVVEFDKNGDSVASTVVSAKSNNAAIKFASDGRFSASVMRAADITAHVLTGGTIVDADAEPAP